MKYWPAAAGDTMTAGKLLVRLTSEDKKEHFTVRKFEISKEQVYANIVSDSMTLSIILCCCCCI